MPAKLTSVVQEDNTVIVTAAFTDEDGNAVTPNAGLTWTLTEPNGTVINSRLDVGLTEATSVDIILFGDDLDSTGATDDGVRHILIEGTYDSASANNLRLDETLFFVIDTQKPLGLYEAKEHLNIEQADTKDDLYISTLIQATREYVENILKRKLITQTVVEYYQEWPSNGYFELPYGALASVTSVKYIDTDDTEYTMSSSDYVVDTVSGRGRVVLGYGKNWPTETLQVVNPIYITMSCGYGSTAAHVPAPIIHAMKVAVSDLFENRESVVYGVGGSVSQLKTIDLLLRPYMLL